MGFTFKKIDDESKFKNIVSYFDEIEQARDQKRFAKPNLKLDGIDKNDEHKTSWMHFSGHSKITKGTIKNSGNPDGISEK